MNSPISEQALQQLFTHARTFGAPVETWLDKPVSNDQLKQIWDLAKYGPTSANCSPMRVVFVQSAEAKAKLKPALDEGNLDKTLTAPVTAIIANDYAFYDKLPYLFPHADARSWFAGQPEKIEVSAMRNATLQGAYVLLAARSIGLDCGPMSGFDNAKVDEAFFKGTQVRSNFLINLGYGNHASLHPRSPRFSFDEACHIA